MRRAQGKLAWVLKAAVLLAAAGLGFDWLVLSGDPERRAALALLQYVPYPVYLAPVLAVLVGSLWLGWAWRALAVANLVLVLTVIMGLCIGHEDEGHGHIRFMTYNIKSYQASLRPHGFSELALEILEHDPDVIVMQDAGMLITLQHGQADLYKAIVGQRQVYAFGQYVVASRFPMKDCAPGWIPYRDQKHSFVHCLVEAHGKQVELVTVHFTTPREGLNATRREGLQGLAAWSGNMNDRLVQSGVLAEHLRLMPKDHPRIVAGDLNAPESSSVVETLLHTGMRDAFSSAGLGYGFTHGHSLKLGLSWLRIDHVLVSDDIGVSQAYVGGKVASEHRPVITDLYLHRQ